ncbi:hypothetical protein V6B33_17120 [Mangrovibacillus sp. Mu-81]|uniref:hypothetical protein n=1 Tax=Mangrovibacillus sp. Mu-81 TaxID=3121478 RepID=UPI002FE43D37
MDRIGNDVRSFNVIKRLFLGLKILLIVIGLFLAVNHYDREPWLILGLFWLVTGIEAAIRSYRHRREDRIS